MKSPQKLQEKLISLSKGTKLHLQLPENRAWNELELKAAGFVVQEFVNARPDVIESDDALREWLDEFRFFLFELKQ